MTNSLPKHFSQLILTLFFFFSLAISPIAADDRQDQVNNMDEDSEGNIAKFNLESADSSTTAFGCLIVASGCITEDGNTVVKTGAVESTTKLISSVMDNPPIRTSTYIADVLHNTGLVKSAYAQGIGFSRLEPVLKIWKAFRNLAYSVYIVIFVIIGFMIMMRQKISNQAVMSIQEALPKLILTLILITFSYAIAGLVVDLMYLSIFLMTGFFEQAGILRTGGGEAARSVIFNQNIIQVGWIYFVNQGTLTSEASLAVGDIVAQIMGGLVGFFTVGIAYLIFAVAILVALFRTLFALISAYIGIVLSVIFAPLQLLVGAFPQSDAFGGWIKGLLANVLVFPAVAAMILIGASLAGSTHQSLGIAENMGNINNGGFLPPLIGYNDAGGNVGSIKAILAFGILMLLPEVGKLVKGAMGIKDNELFGSALKNAMAGKAVFSAPVKAAKGAIGLASNALIYGQYGVKIADIVRAGKDAPKGKRFDAIKQQLRGDTHLPGSRGLENTTVPAVKTDVSNAVTEANTNTHV